MKGASFLNRLFWLVLLFATTALGDSNSPPDAVSSSNIVGWLHWVGLDHLRADPRAGFFLRLWDLPESRRLESQTLDKLAETPSRIAPPLPGTTNVPTALFRPLLDDLLRNECALEIRHVDGRHGEIGFAIRLDPQRSALWETNFIGIMQYLTHLRAVSFFDRPGWWLRKHHVPNWIEFTRAGDWTLMGLAQNDNPLLREMAARAARGEPPLPARDTNDWFEAECEPRHAVTTLRPLWYVRPGWPRFSLNLSGHGTNVLARGQASFPKPLPVRIDSWTIPANLLRTNLTSFTAVRGFAPAAARRFWWTNSPIGPPPDQYFLWTASGSPMQTYLAVPMTNAVGATRALSEIFLTEGNRWLAKHLIGRFVAAPDANGIVLSGLPLISPFLKSVDFGNGTAIVAGMMQPPVPAPAGGGIIDMTRDVESGPNLVYYDWENSSRELDAGLYLAQMGSMMERRPPLRLDSASAAWLRAIGPQLGTATTRISLTAPNELSFERTATIGFTALELSVLADWLESPDFPFPAHRSP